MGASSPATSTDIAAPYVNGNFDAVSCADATDCTGLGRQTSGGAFAMTESHGVWSGSYDFAQGIYMSSVSCPNSTYCVAAGYDNGLAATITEVDGTWGTPDVTSLDGTYWGVSCVDDSDCTAVGVDNSDEQAVASTETAGTWGPVVEFASLTTSFGDNSQLQGVSCTSAGGCTAVGYDGGEPSYVTESQGAWGDVVVLPLDGGESGFFEAVSCSDATDCTAVGAGQANDSLMYATESNDVWSTPATYPPTAIEGTFTSISCVDALNCVAVGINSTAPTFYASEVNGEWGPISSVPTVDGTGEFYGVSCPDQTCTAAGIQFVDNTLAPMYATETDGTWSTMTAVALPGTAGSLSSVSCSDATHCVAMGTDSGNNLPFEVDDVNGVWGSASEVQYNGPNLWGGRLITTTVSCSDENDCVALGYHALTSNFQALFDVSKTNGTWGNIEWSDGIGEFLGLSCADATDCTAVGFDDGSDTPMYATGSDDFETQFDLASPNPGGEFTSVSCPDAADCTAVGTDGDGAPLVASEIAGTWGPVIDLPAPGNNASLLGVSCAASLDCTAVGEGAAGQPIYYTEVAGVWGALTSLAAPISGTLFSVSCSDATDCTAVGGDATSGQPFYVNESAGVWGASTDAPATGGSGAFHSVSCTSDLHCVAVGVDTGDGQPLYDDLTPRTNLPPPPPPAVTTTTTTTTVPTTTTTFATTTTTTVPAHKTSKLRATLYFSRGSAALTRSDVRVLRRLTASVVAAKVRALSIVGYGSPSGGATLNQRLSLDRARVVARELRVLLRTKGRHVVRFVVRGGGIRRALRTADDQIAVVIS